MSFDWKSRQNNIGKHEHVASQILDEQTGEPTEPSTGGGTDLSPLTWDGNTLRQPDGLLGLEASTLTVSGMETVGVASVDENGNTRVGVLMSAHPSIENVRSIVLSVLDDDFNEKSSVVLNAGAGAGAGGAAVITSGDAASGSDANGGDIELAAGSGDATGDGGRITLNGGLSPEGGVGSAGTFQGGFSSGAGGFIELVSGNGGPGTDANGGDITLTAGNGDGSGDGGSVDLSGGDSAGGGTAGGIFLQGSPGNLNGGDVTINGGAGGDNDALGGDVYIQGGAGSGSGRAGLVILGNLPTANPSVAGALWNDGGTLKVSAG